MRRSGRRRGWRSEAEVLLRLIDRSPDGVLVTRPDDGCVLVANDASCGLLGLPAADVVGRTTAELGVWPGGTRELSDGLVPRGAGGSLATTSVVRGRPRTLEYSAALVELGGVEAILMVLRPVAAAHHVDVNAVRHAVVSAVGATSALAESWHAVSGALSGAVPHDSLLLVLRDGDGVRVVLGTGAAGELLRGRRIATAEALTQRAFLGLQHGSLTGEEGAVAEALRSAGGRYTVGVPLGDPAAAAAVLLCGRAQFGPEAFEVLRVVATDLSELLPALLPRATRSASPAWRSLAHDMRTPVATVTTWSTLLREDWEMMSDEQRREALAAIERNARVIARLASELGLDESS